MENIIFYYYQMLTNFSILAIKYSNLVPSEGLEPSRPCGQQILSLPCLPFHHKGNTIAINATTIILLSSKKKSFRQSRRCHNFLRLSTLIKLILIVTIIIAKIICFNCKISPSIKYDIKEANTIRV